MRHRLTCCAVPSRLLLASLIGYLLSAQVVMGQDTTPNAPQKLETPPGVLYVPDLIYGMADGKTELQLDLARPANGKGPFPAVVCLPGGGWVSCDRKANVPLILKLAREGYVAICVTYRCARDAPCPAPIHDVKCAVRWLCANAAKYRIDPDRIAALGYSAGGHLACMLGTTNAKELEGDGGHAGHSSRVQAVVSYYGLLDLGELHDEYRRGERPGWEGALVHAALKTFVAGPPETQAERLRRVSPIRHVSSATAPTLLLHGTKDTLVPLRQSERFAERLKNANVEVRLVTLPGAGHNFDGFHQIQARGEVLAFLKRHLQPPLAVLGSAPPSPDAPPLLADGPEARKR